MKVTKILKDYVNYDDGKHDRKIGRYWASEIYRMRKGYFKPEDFFEKEKIGLTGARNIITGIASENIFADILETLEVDFKHEPKKVLKLNDNIELVIKTDFLFNGFVVETKHPTREINEIPPWYKDQLECTGRAFENEVYLGIFTVPFDLKLFPYELSDKRWEEIQKIVRKFHRKLENIS